MKVVEEKVRSLLDERFALGREGAKNVAVERVGGATCVVTLEIGGEVLFGAQEAHHVLVNGFD